MRRDPLVTDFVNQLNINQDEASASMTAIRQKWNLGFFTFDSSGSGEFSIQKILPAVMEHIPARFVSGAHTPHYIRDKRGDLFMKEQDHLYLDINLSTLDTNDAREVRRQVWELVRTRIQERRNVLGGIKQQQAKPCGDPPEVAFVYHAKDETFSAYLRWYDLHHARRLSLRAIADIESLRKKSALNAEKLLEKYIHQDKKVKIRRSIKEEGKIQKGVNLIRRAIYRTKDSSQNSEDYLNKYNCPQHGQQCPKTCSTYKEWINIFNRLYPEDLPALGLSYVENYKTKDKKTEHREWYRLQLINII